MSKDYLFPLEWPWTVWLINLSYPVLIVWLYEKRRAAGLVSTRETAVMVGSLSLFALFVLSLGFNAARFQLAVQLQPARVFWMLDFLATIYVVWALMEAGDASARRARLVALSVCALTVTRGAYVALVAFPDRPMFAPGLTGQRLGARHGVDAAVVSHQPLARRPDARHLVWHEPARGRRARRRGRGRRKTTPSGCTTARSRCAPGIE